MINVREFRDLTNLQTLIACKFVALALYFHVQVEFLISDHY